MGNWMCGCRVYYLPIMKEITAPIHPRDGFMLARESVFFRLLSFSAEGMKFDSARHFARYSALPGKQCETVWDVCIEHNVLRKSGDSFTALPWMEETGLIKPVRLSEYSQNASSRIENTGGDTNTPNVKKEPQRATQAQETASPTGRRKIAVRENVFLTQTEIDTLKSRFPDERLGMMLDKLNEYKTNNGVRYRSDFDAFDRWLVRWLEKEILAKEGKEITNEYYEKNGAVQHEGNKFPEWLA